MSKYVITDHEHHTAVIISAKSIYKALQIYLRDWATSNHLTVQLIDGEG